MVRVIALWVDIPLPGAATAASLHAAVSINRHQVATPQEDPRQADTEALVASKNIALTKGFKDLGMKRPVIFGHSFGDNGVIDPACRGVRGRIICATTRELLGQGAGCHA